MKKEYWFNAILINLVIIGFMLGNLFGGIIIGVSSTLIILVIFGKRLASKAITRIDTRVKNVIMDNLK